MGFIAFIFMLLIAALTGSVGARIAGRKNLGCLTSMLLGFVGAAIGTLIARELDLPSFLSLRFGGSPFPVVWAVLGSALFVAFLNLVSRPSR